jgi:hypothetical protein
VQIQAEASAFSLRQSVREDRPIFLFSVTGALSIGIMRPVVKLITHLQVMHTIRMSGAIPSFHHTPSCLSQRQLYFTLLRQSVFKSMKFVDNVAASRLCFNIQ